jgi:N-acetyl-beta-hexosaminidase
MCLISTPEAAEVMLKSGSYFTAAILGKKLSITAKDASGLLYNIRTAMKYDTIETELPNRTVKVVAISGRKVNKNDLWRLALGIVKTV